MKPRTLLILLALVLVLGVFIWFYERKLPSSDERVDLAKKVLAVKKDDVQGLTLESAAGKAVLVRTETPAAKDDTKKDKEKKEKEGEEGAQGTPESEWKLVQPMASRADAFAVNGLLDALTGLQKTRTLDKIDRHGMGLDKPRATVRVKTSGGEQVLRFGAEVPTGGELIAAFDGKDSAYVVPDSILTQVDRQPGSWRDRQLFRASRDAISRIALTGAPGGPVVLAQKDGGFRIDRPLADRADREKTDTLYADLSGLSAETFIDDAAQAPAALGLQPPRGVIEVAFEKGEPVRLELGNAVEPAAAAPASAAPPAVYARLGSQIFQARTRLADDALRPPAEWRARGLSGFEVFQVESATVREGQGSLRLTRAGTDWKRDDKTISYVPVSDFLFAVTGARADRLLTPAQAQALGIALDKPVLTVDLEAKLEKGAGGGGKETLTLYPPVAAGTPARVSGRDVVLLLPADKLKEIQGKLGDVRTAKPLK